MASEEPVILVAIDRSQQSEDAFKYYLNTLHRPNHKVCLAHVAELPADIYEARASAMSPGIIMEEWKKEEEKSKELFKKYRDIAQEGGVTNTKETLKQGMNPGHVITEAAKEQKASTVVMGTRGMGTIRRTILGSVSDFVLHHAHCPVVICRK